jgi:hypothetical protein
MLSFLKSRVGEEDKEKMLKGSPNGSKGAATLVELASAMRVALDGKGDDIRIMLEEFMPILEVESISLSCPRCLA